MGQNGHVEMEPKLFDRLREYAYKKVVSDSVIVDKAVKSYLNNHPIENKDLPIETLIQKGVLCYSLKQRERKKVVNILMKEQELTHRRGEYLPPDDHANNLYYVLSGTYFERRKIPSSSNGMISMTQDLIVEDEIFGEEFIGDPFSSFWEPSPEGRVLKISPYARNELIRKVPKIKDNLEYLVVEKFKKMDYISTVRSSHLNTEDKVRYGFNFLSQRLGHTMNGDSSKIDIFKKFNGGKLPMGHLSDYGKCRRIMHDDIGDLLSISRESVSRMLNRRCFNLNENNFRISFKRNGNTYIYNHLLNKDGKIIKLSNINN